MRRERLACSAGRTSGGRRRRACDAACYRWTTGGDSRRRRRGIPQLHGLFVQIYGQERFVGLGEARLGPDQSEACGILPTVVGSGQRLRRAAHDPDDLRGGESRFACEHVRGNARDVRARHARPAHSRSTPVTATRIRVPRRRLCQGRRSLACSGRHASAPGSRSG